MFPTFSEVLTRTSGSRGMRKARAPCLVELSTCATASAGGPCLTQRAVSLGAPALTGLCLAVTRNEAEQVLLRVSSPSPPAVPGAPTASSFESKPTVVVVVVVAATATGSDGRRHSTLHKRDKDKSTSPHLSTPHPRPNPTPPVACPARQSQSHRLGASYLNLVSASDWPGLAP